MDEVDFYPELLVNWFSLALYGHPFRAISSLHENDVAFHKDLQLDPKLVDELAIRTEFRIMNLQKDD
ncbi:hypothetical protein CH35J_000539 [Colletotrichum higginsianum]|uniref:Uncharacterized protein n=1 Tax=Colletotrichum higginsianum TaxID=80884 RepID=A0A4T0WKM1_9PEZI|nr:hypothetical protein CH35J_000539 [Colletotrichum higginsianum]